MQQWVPDVLTARACALFRALCESVLLSCWESVLHSCSKSESWPSRSRCRVSVVSQHTLTHSQDHHPTIRALVQAPSRARAAVAAQAVPKKVLMMGGTRFIGLYLARQLVEEGHDVTLFTRGKSEVCPQIPDDTDTFYRNFSSCVPPLSLHSNRAVWPRVNGGSELEGDHRFRQPCLFSHHCSDALALLACTLYLNTTQPLLVHEQTLLAQSSAVPLHYHG